MSLGLKTSGMLAISAVVALATGVGSAGAAKRPTSCAVKGSKTLASSRVVRVYETKSAEGTTLRACRLATGKRFKLTEGFDDGFVTSSAYKNVLLRGSFVGWSEVDVDVSCKADCPPGYQPTHRFIGVYDTARGSSRGVPDGAPIGKALVMTPRGGVAWAARAATGGAVEIHASARKGEDKILDSGAIDPKTLAIEITIISWTKDGAEKFARLS